MPGHCAADKPQANQAVLAVHGKVLDSAGNPLSDASVLPCHNGRPFLPKATGGEREKDFSTGRNGLFMIEIPAPAETIKDGKWSIKITRPSFKPSQMIPLKISGQETDEKGAERFTASVSLSIDQYRGLRSGLP